jgi:hypothetical protein
MAFLHDITYVLGVHKDTASLQDEGVSRHSILQLLIKGADGYRQLEESLFKTAIQVGESTLLRSGINRDEVDVLIFSTNSIRSPEFQDDFGHALITALGLRKAFVQSVGFQNCGDSVPALLTADALIESGKAKKVLLIIADDATRAGVPRILKDSYLHSDGAVAGMVSVSSKGLSIGKSAVIHAPVRETGIHDPHDLQYNLTYLLSKAAKKAVEWSDENGGYDFVVTHNMNRLYNMQISSAFDVPLDCVIGEFKLGHCLASDVLINLVRMVERQTFHFNGRGLLVVPTSRSIGVLELTRVCQTATDRSLGSILDSEELV